MFIPDFQNLCALIGTGFVFGFLSGILATEWFEGPEILLLGSEISDWEPTTVL